MNTIDFAAARKRIESMQEVTIEFDPSCLVEVPRTKTLIELLRECTDEVGTFGVREELFHAGK